MNGPDLATRLRMTAVASCECGTKRPEHAFHAKSCRYRVICEAADELEKQHAMGAAHPIGTAIWGGGSTPVLPEGATLDIMAKDDYCVSVSGDVPSREAVWVRWIRPVGGRAVYRSCDVADLSDVVFFATRESPDAGALASQQKEDPTLKQIFGYTATGPASGETYVRFVQAFETDEGYEIHVRNGAGDITGVRLPTEQAHALARAILPAAADEAPDAPDGITDGGKAWAAACEQDPILQFFTFGHLPERLQAASIPFCHAAINVVTELPRNAERSTALRKLLEAKDAAVRALLFK